MKYLFGPVKSRRLGLSLGIDLVPHKTCSLNCVYCECGETTDLTVDVREYVPVDEVLSELEAYLAGEPVLDVITFSGAGEPTLHSRIGHIIDFIKDNYAYKVAVLTNSTLLWREDVRAALARADLVVPSIDTVTRGGMDRLLRCHHDLTPEQLIKGLQLFTHGFAGEVVLEVFVVEGINDSDDEIDAVIDVCKTLRFDGVQINTLDRPGAEAWVRPLSDERLRYVYLKFRQIGAEMIGVKKVRETGVPLEDIEEAFVSLISRRPATVDDLAVVFGMPETDVMKYIDSLHEKYNIEEHNGERGVFFRIIPGGQ